MRPHRRRLSPHPATIANSPGSSPRSFKIREYAPAATRRRWKATSGAGPSLEAPARTRRDARSASSTRIVRPMAIAGDGIGSSAGMPDAPTASAAINHRPRARRTVRRVTKCSSTRARRLIAASSSEALVGCSRHRWRVSATTATERVQELREPVRGHCASMGGTVLARPPIRQVVRAEDDIPHRSVDCEIPVDRFSFRAVMPVVERGGGREAAPRAEFPADVGMDEPGTRQRTPLCS